MIVSYRMNATTGLLHLPTVNDLNLAFNRVVQKLQLEGWGITPETIGKQVRMEGKVKIEKKTYDAISQGGLIVVSKGPKIPDQIELRT